MVARLYRPKILGYLAKSLLECEGRLYPHCAAAAGFLMNEPSLLDFVTGCSVQWCFPEVGYCFVEEAWW
jgi:hypothetical protein